MWVRGLVCGGVVLGLAACSGGGGGNKAAGPGVDQKATPGVCDNSGVDASTYLNGIVSGQKLGQNNPISSRIVNLYFQSDEGTAICTGSLLPGNVVLTAGHCVPSSPDNIFVIFNNNLNCLTGDNVTTFARKVTAIERNPNYFGGTSDRDYDLSMLHFEGTLPFGYTTFDFPKGDITVESTDKLIMSGYGVTNYNDHDSAGVLRITSLSGGRLSHDPMTPKSLIIDQHDTGVCSGDSGSPLMVYRNGRLSIVGVASTVMNRQGDESHACNDSSSFVDISQHQLWLQTTYEELRDK